MDHSPDIRKIAFVGNYSPRKCGIATFTTDLCESVALRFPAVQCFAVPVTDIPEGYSYPDRVRFEIKEQDLDSYKRAADFINISQTDVVCIQHEYGIFGGPAGSNILSIMRNLNAPIVTTLHTVLTAPTAQQKRVLEDVVHLSDIVVVMTAKAAEFLKTIYKIDEGKIRLIPHGIPDVSFIDPNFYKDQFGVEGKTVLLTFGLISPNKGIENVVKALPSVINKFPNFVYMVLGETHPNLVRNEGEVYRLGLQRLAEELGVDKNIIFYNRFVSIEELKEFIVMADLYITPYLTEEQVVSGTLAYSFGAGNAIISTPFYHAAELLGNNRGVLVPFNDPPAIAQAILSLLQNDIERHLMRKNAYLAGRDMVWPNVATRYRNVFGEARLRHPMVTRRKVTMKPLDMQQHELPAIKIGHMQCMTDTTGILQHASYNVPNFSEGYCTDDNARALILTVLFEELEAVDPKELLRLGTIYLSFLNYAFDRTTRRFRNFMGYDKRWNDETGSEDSHGRAIWALGTCIARSAKPGFQNLAGMLFERALSSVVDFTSPRAWAFGIIGIHEYLRRFNGDLLVHNARQALAGKLYDLYLASADTEWPWFEQEVTYCNSRLSQALILSGRWMDNGDMLNAGLNSLRWLAKIQTSSKNHFRPIGANAFYRRHSPLPAYDQQPIEAHSMISACLEAYRTTGEITWYNEAWKAFQWFLGRNDLGLSVYDSQTGGCRDALHIDRLNQNQGAESTLAFGLSLAEMTDTVNTLENLTAPQPK
ncbi:MAG: glycosyl transferase family 1 [Candidatus Raymondbacteria bacterium RifOxyA12_full_50_37]|uniref:Glycosyl transferase family 1 n=1 Tax=Candidatus Raymondbacteria bacterium RIFOXYD12_FULL_49_13 TaxID=1817890 RepID=A0A1F7F3R9_UNCRA|nr:MAG: glycosyl transferase family 1 [Candidatus Raymondbacteria bacterium RifOxyA12_full_50_37]OGJ90350.1 MAG: glycosyl transferase family 1 [Candidatus Raymondbacteria bacterium RIFOXYA2_FULL_49_16]OGK01314.1 MAG: glycosyl transferase family 1 [Candidatus Raymondbacteria bacterium RIFOXYD12_FULL_49_13]OGP43249.1 MAG: glycosyl transferase family 1 [Candidatus Raymondbacteria bacterium RIFOXYB2_FULL_49_35]